MTTSTIIDLTTWTPAEIDRLLADLSKVEQTALSRAARMRQTARTAARPAWRIAEDEALVARYQAEAAEARSAAEPLEAEFSRRGGWLRYFLVTNGNGHVHRGMGCQTCYPTTEFAWLIDLADCDEAAMIAEFGEKACTVCFPDAPANPAYHGPGRRDAAAQAARAAEKAEREASKAAKAITAVDGSPLRIPDLFHPQFSELIRTKVAARNALSDAVQSYGWYGTEGYLARAAVLVPALEAAGIDTAAVIARASAKVAKEAAEHRWPA